MSQSELVSIGGRLAWIGGALVAAVAAASLSIAAFPITAAMLRGNPPPDFMPHLPQLDTAGGLLLLAALTLGVAARG